MKPFLFVFIGGGLGSMLRYGLGQWIGALHRSSFPWATLTINVLACLALGLATGLADHKQLLSPMARLFWTVGFCGGFSTFSTFSGETLFMLQAGLTFSLAAYIILSCTLCVAAVYGGVWLTLQHPPF